MKKLILLIVVVILNNCEIRPRQVCATTYPSADSYGYGRYQFTTETHEGMEYGIWALVGGGSQTGYAIHVVNLTKEKLEVELLKKQLNKDAVVR